MNEHHYHLHDETGMCYGDTIHFDAAALVAAEHIYPWMVPDHEPESEDGWLVVIDAPHCIQDCREEEN